MCTLQTVFLDTVYATQNTQTVLASETADNLLWAKLTTDAVPELAHAFARVEFREEAAPRPLRAAIDGAASAYAQAHGARPLVVLGRSRRAAVANHRAELQELCAEKGAGGAVEAAKALGDVACGFIVAGSSASLLVVQASQR